MDIDGASDSTSDPLGELALVPSGTVTIGSTEAETDRSWAGRSAEICGSVRR